jgi:hypothetical protein
MPTATPPIKRKIASTNRVPATPLPTALIRNRIAATTITARRPAWSAIRPAENAPSAAPTRVDDTARPRAAALAEKTFSIAPTAPLITAES